MGVRKVKEEGCVIKMGNKGLDKSFSGVGRESCLFFGKVLEE